MLHDESVYSKPHKFIPDRYSPTPENPSGEPDPSRAAFGFGRRYLSWMTTSHVLSAEVISWQNLSWEILCRRCALSGYCVYTACVQHRGPLAVPGANSGPVVFGTCQVCFFLPPGSHLIEQTAVYVRSVPSPYPYKFTLRFEGAQDLVAGSE